LRGASVKVGRITQISPDYEHGMAFYDLACALEELGEIKQAQKAYERALFYVPDDHIRISGYASFMYLHGDPHKAFEAYLDLLKIYNNHNDNDGISNCHQALYSLGKKMGWSSDKVLQAMTLS
jgi:tetratricopeptide (TPR) repeat protein